MRNRLWLALVGAGLFIGGGAVLATWFAVHHSHRAAQPVFSAPDRHRGLVIALAALAIAGGAAWLIAQLRRDALYGRAVRRAARINARIFVADIEIYPGVDRARARICGSIRHPQVHTTITCDPRTDIQALHHQLRTDALTRLRTTLRRPDLTATTTFRTPRHPPP